MVIQDLEMEFQDLEMVIQDLEMGFQDQEILPQNIIYYSLAPGASAQAPGSCELTPRASEQLSIDKLSYFMHKI